MKIIDDIIWEAKKHIKEDVINEITVNIGRKGNFMVIRFIDHYNEYREITINSAQFNRCKKLYTNCGLGDNFKRDMILLVSLYDFLSTKNMHLGAPSALLKSIQFDAELFGSPLNSSLVKYCSAFDIERKFGSIGSFFDWKITDGTYWVNPPFVERLLNETARVLNKYLSYTNKLIFAIVIPCWGKFECYDTLSQSKYLKSQCILKKIR